MLINNLLVKNNLLSGSMKWFLVNHKVRTVKW